MTDRWPTITGSMPPFADHPDRACAGQDTDLWFPEHGGTGAVRAINICRECPLVARCADWALQQPHLRGVWGGLTETDRRRVRRGLPVADRLPRTIVRPPIPIGRRPKSTAAVVVKVRAKVAALDDAGYNIGEIAERVGYSYRTIQRHLRALGRARTNGGTRIAA